MKSKNVLGSCAVKGKWRGCERKKGGTGKNYSGSGQKIGSMPEKVKIAKSQQGKRVRGRRGMAER